VAARTGSKLHTNHLRLALACEGGGSGANGVETHQLVFVGFAKWVGWRSPHHWPTSLGGGERRALSCVESTSRSKEDEGVVG
jgi:hypothetical protein